MAILIKSNGAIEEISPKSGAFFEMDELRRLISGEFEQLAIGQDHTMIVNESGKSNGLPVNDTATMMAVQSGIIDVIVGDVLLAPNFEMEE